MLSANKSYKRPNKFGAKQFIVAHYAGEVSYEVEGFVEKNNDSISALIIDLLASSKTTLIGAIYTQNKQYTSEKKTSSQQLISNSLSN